MNNVFIPISCYKDQNRELTVSRLRELGAKRVFLAAADRFPFYECEYLDAMLAQLKDALDYYSGAGFETGVWIITYGYGSPLAHYNREFAKDLTRIRSIRGKTADDAFCPLDPRFLSAMCDTVKRIAKLGARMIMLDDELCLSVRPGLGCACDRHLEKLSERIGEKIELCELESKVFCGSPSVYRKEWLALMGDTMRDFCKALRSAVDSVDPTVRMGFCAGYTSWDVEGVSALELTKVLAGDTKPFLRFTGAPYWIATGRFKDLALENIIESVRMQAAWAEGSGVEVFAEGDTWPRSRYYTPAAYSEIFDLALRGFSGLDNLKYVFNYSMQPDYDNGYSDAHIENSSALAKTVELTGGMQEVGVRVYEQMRKLENAELPAKLEIEKDVMRWAFFGSAQRLLSQSSIPTVYSGRGVCGIAFGENAKYLTEDELSGGLILDLKAAQYLKARGVDTGLISAERLCSGYSEHFDGKKVEAFNVGTLYSLSLADGAIPMGELVSDDILNKDRHPSCYYYKNKDGQSFFVFAWSADEQAENSAVFRNYYRSAQLTKAIELLSGKTLPVTVDAHPHLYCLCKQDAKGTCVMLFNIHADAIKELGVHFDRSVVSVTAVGANAVKSGERTATVERLEPFGFVTIYAKQGE